MSVKQIPAKYITSDGIEFDNRADADKREELLRAQDELFNRSGLTFQENEVMVNLVAAWSAFNNLPQLAPDHLADFRRAIHECQRILATRVVKRDYPKFWN